MATFFSTVLIVLSVALSIPILVLVFEILAALLYWRQRPPNRSIQGPHAPVAVLVPAHNEGAGIAATIADIRAQLRAEDRLIVIADNCSDDTAQVARQSGAEVVVRQDAVKVGKGYALDRGIRFLDANPRDVVIIVDADCRLSEGSIAQLALACIDTGCPAQSLDLLVAPADSAVNLRIAEFAWRVKNWVRPLGLKSVGLPCQLMGTGMAFPWAVIRAADLASGHIVEDLKLGLELVAAGSPPTFCPSARVTSYFPTSAAAAATQRARWEQGHIQLILALAPRFLFKALARRNGGLLALVLDLAVPPLSLLALLTVAIFSIAGAGLLLGASPIAFIVSSTSLIAFAGAVLLCWAKCGQDLLPPGAIVAVVPYALGKLRIYGGLAVRRGVSQWVRTDRN